MEEGTIVSWFVKVGDTVKSSEMIADVETDKATMELENFEKGEVLYLLPEGTTVPVETAIAVIGKKGEDFQDLLKEAPAAEAEPAKAAAPTPAAAAWGSEGPLAGTGAERPPSFSRGDTPLGDLATHLLACRRGGRPYVFCLYSYVLPGRGARAEGGPGGALCRVGERGGAREAHCCPAASICARLVDGAVPGVAHRASRSARRPPSPSPSPRARSSSLLRASEVADEPRARAPPAPARPPACTG